MLKHFENGHSLLQMGIKFALRQIVLMKVRNSQLSMGLKRLADKANHGECVLAMSEEARGLVVPASIGVLCLPG